MSTGCENQCRSCRCPSRLHVTPLNGGTWSVCVRAVVAVALRPFLGRSLMCALGTPTKGSLVFPPVKNPLAGWQSYLKNYCLQKVKFSDAKLCQYTNPRLIIFIYIDPYLTRWFVCRLEETIWIYVKLVDTISIHTIPSAGTMWIPYQSIDTITILNNGIDWVKNNAN